MAKVETYVCDSCGNFLKNPYDGFIVRGMICDATGKGGLIGGNEGLQYEGAFCVKCFDKALKPPLIQR